MCTSPSLATLLMYLPVEIGHVLEHVAQLVVRQLQYGNALAVAGSFRWGWGVAIPVHVVEQRAVQRAPHFGLKQHSLRDQWCASLGTGQAGVPKCAVCAAL